ncbi:hypothetical protein Q757_03390 [Oenococcus alcoholitolerans]|uniref:Uncharacterized protein n=1 Tax=Oenococcus alcoholitolerans TaxID=931074 RepID=A0ABR4XRE1_9LACO|nr:hypothetical protein Q757_03390 [Oenococcus alcoholitolerans]
MADFFCFFGQFYFSAFNGLPSNSGQPIKPYHYVAPDHFSIKHRDNFAENRIQKKIFLLAVSIKG